LNLAAEFTLPWSGFQRFEFGEYFFFFPIEYKAERNSKTLKPTGDYVIEGNSGGETFKVCLNEQCCNLLYEMLLVKIRCCGS
jgi:hypothetical protein